MIAPSKSAAAAKNFAAKRLALADQLADIILAEGLNDLGLRPAAARLGTSDRMLLYYFGTKAELVTAVLTRVSERQSKVLNASPTAPRRKPHRVLAGAWTVVSDPQFVPFMRIWAEVASRGTRNEHPFREIASKTISSWLAWIETRLDMPAGKSRTENAAAILTILEGATLLEMSIPGSTAGVGNLLTKALRKLVR